MTIAFYDAAQVQELLDYPGCIDAMRRAMIALSTGERAQPLRQIWPVSDGNVWGIMPGELLALSTFGAKLVSVFADAERPGCTRHQGVVVAYDSKTGAVSCIADAEPITRIRTACATAVATDAMARKDSEVLAIFGTGVQAEAHLYALPLVRDFREILLWGRSPEKTRAFAGYMRVRRSISASASVLALATISSASCLARSRSASRSLSADLALASYSAFSASASFRSDSASVS